MITAALAACTLAQGDPLPGADELIARFRTLSNLQKAVAVRDLQRRVADDPDPYLRRVLAQRLSFRSCPVQQPPPFHDPAVWAPGVAPPRVLVRQGEPAHQAVRERIPPVTFLGELAAAVTYDWRRGEIVRRDQPLGFDEIFANAARGYPPGSDQAVAMVLKALDRDSGMRPVAAWFGHLYADLQARAYEGVTLYEAWYSGQPVAVPDVDAIPFERTVLGTRTFVSPIPADARRTGLYARIKKAARDYRVYRTLREAAAAAFVHASPGLDPLYADLLPRFHYLWEQVGHDPARMADKLAAAGSRDRLIAEVDAAVRKDADAFERREAAGKALRAMNDRVRRWAHQALEAAARPR